MAKSERATETQALLAALIHPARRQILRAMDGSKETCPGELAEQLEGSLDKIAYHTRVLADCGAVKLVRREQAAGSTRHLYRLSVRAAWARKLLEETEGEPPGGDS